MRYLTLDSAIHAKPISAPIGTRMEPNWLLAFIFHRGGMVIGIERITVQLSAY